MGTRKALEVFPPSLSSLGLIMASPAVCSQALTLTTHLEGVPLLRPVQGDLESCSGDCRSHSCGSRTPKKTDWAQQITL